MKKLSMILMAAMLVLAMSCKKEKAEEEPVGQGFSAIMENQGGNDKTSLVGTDVWWEQNDAIFVNNGNETVKFGLTSSVENKGYFNADVTSGFYTNNYTAYYPAYENGNIWQNGTLSLPQTQTCGVTRTVENKQFVSFASGANPTVASSTTATLPFKNVCGLLALQLTGTCKVSSIELTANGGIKLWGSGTVSLTDPTKPKLSSLNGGGSTITLNCGGGGVQLDATNPTTFYFVLPPVKLTSGFSVKLTDTENKVWTQSASSSIEIKRSMLKNMAKVNVVTAYPVPSVTLNEGSLSGTTYTANGTVSVSSSATCKYGFVYSTNATPIVSNGIKAGETTGTIGSTAVQFTTNISGLTQGTTYYVRAYATLDNTNYTYSTTIATVTIPQPVTASSTIAQDHYCSKFTYTVKGTATLSASGTCEYGIVYGTSSNPTTANTMVTVATSTFSGAKNFTVDMRNRGLSPDVTYYVRAYTICNGTTNYSSQITIMLPKPWSNGASPYPFKGGLYFSHGNLQYNASGCHEPAGGLLSIGGTWKFADNQYDYKGDNNTQASSTYTGWIDLFQWGTSGYYHNLIGSYPNATWVPWSNNMELGWPGGEHRDLYNQADWGYNKISNGGDTENSGWRTPTMSEWQGLTSKMSQCTVCGVKGALLVPENWTGGTKSSYTASSNPSWEEAEAAGAVFLPYGGAIDLHDPSTVGYINKGSWYWSSTYFNGLSIFGYESAYNLQIGTTGFAGNVALPAGYRIAVRLVKK